MANILPPTLKTITPSHCTDRLAAGTFPQKLSIRLGATAFAPPYSARALHAMGRHARLAPRQARPPHAVPAGTRAYPGGAAPVVRPRRFRRGRDTGPAGGAGRGSASAGLC